MSKLPLFDSPPTARQQIVAGIWAVNLAIVLVIWTTTSLQLFSGGPANIMLALGRLTGLLAAYFALIQFMLLGRVLWIERPFGLDRLAAFHRLNGYAAFTSLLLHPMFIIAGYSLSSQTGLFQQASLTIREFPYVWMAFIAELLFIAVVISSIYIVRRRLRFETWYWVHLAVYAAIVLAFFHQFALGGSFTSAGWERAYWYVLYAFVALNVLFYRFTLPSLNLLRFGFKVEQVEAETPTTTSVYITGRNLRRWPAKAGQYVLIRILTKDFILEEHPFSLSALPGDNNFRLTIRRVGDYTEKLSGLHPGSYVLTAGPYGRFTRDVARTDKRLFIAGGIGITPIRPLAEEAVTNGLDSVLLYASRSTDDIVFQKELAGLAGRGMKLWNFIPGGDAAPSTDNIRPGRISLESIAELVPDYAERDIYICGPPAMIDSLRNGLQAAGVPTGQLHFELFSLHN